MIAEFELVYRLLDLPEEADGGHVRQSAAERLKVLETQKESAGSRPERLMAAKALGDFTRHAAEIERLASALDTTRFLAEAAEALEARKLAKTRRALGNARTAAEASGLARLVTAVTEAEDNLADSGLVHDPALDVAPAAPEAAVAAPQAPVAVARPAAEPPARLPPVPPPIPILAPVPVPTPAPPPVAQPAPAMPPAAALAVAAAAVDVDATIRLPAVVKPAVVAAARFTLLGPKGECCHVVHGNRVVFGRSSAADVPVHAFHPKNPKERDRVTRAISRAHFTVLREDDGSVFLCDGAPDEAGTWQASANGTFDENGNAVSRERLPSPAFHRIRITQEAEPAIAPRWEVSLQQAVKLPAEVSRVCGINTAGADALLLRRLDGGGDHILIVWRAADLRDLNLCPTESAIVRSSEGFLLWQDSRLVPLETGFRVGGVWQVDKLGSLTLSK